METELKDPSIPTRDMNAITSQYCSDNPSPASQLPASFASPSPVADSEFEGLQHHRRRFSDGNSQFAGDDFGISGEPFVGPSTGSLDEMWTEDELQAVFLDLERLGPLEDDCHGGGYGGAISLMDHDGGDSESEKRSGFEVISEHKKAVRHEKWTQMWAVEPPRFKRIMRNKQYAARTKERKARELLELRQQVQCLRSKAKSLSLQLTMSQRDVSTLSAENTELKIRLKVMEQQAHIHHALTEALKQEAERVKNSTRKMRVPSESFGLEARGNLYSPLASLSTLPMQQNPLLSPTTQSAEQQKLQISPLDQQPLHQSPYSPLASPLTQLSPPSSLTQLSPPSPLTQLSPPSSSLQSLNSPLVSSPTLRPMHRSLATSSILQLAQKNSCSPLTSPSTRSVPYSSAASSPRSTLNTFPLPKQSVPMLTQLPPMHNSQSSLSRRRHLHSKQNDPLDCLQIRSQ